MGGFAEVQEALDGLLVGGHAEGTGTDQAFKCPAHQDRVASGSLKEGKDGRALLHCHAGCSTEEIVEALGLEMKDLFVGERHVEDYYVYTDEMRNPLYRVVRFSPKGFTQERYEEGGTYAPGLGDVRRVLYHLPEVLASQSVYVVEGEKDVERLRGLGLVATCNVGGASSWRPEWAESLRGKDVIIVPDNDEPGEKHARTIQASLDGVAHTVRVLYPASGKDISDHLDAGLPLSELAHEPEAEEAFEPIDYETYAAGDVDWLMEPYFPTRGRVLVYGKAGSLKSLWVMWVATRLAREGKKVAYFSLEMRPEQTVARLQKLKPPKDKFKVYTKYRLGDPEFLRRTITALKGFDMIVVDSWNAAYRFSKGQTHDDQVAELDDKFFQPIIEGTGATLVLIDNVGHDITLGFGNKVETQHPRGTSAKVDKVDISIWLTRPEEQNNYMTEIHVKKMRYDLPIPAKRVVVAPSDHDGIEFFYTDAMGEPEENMWEEKEVPDGDNGSTEVRVHSDRGSDTEIYDQNAVLPVEGADPLAGLSPTDKLAFLRLQKAFGGEVEYSDVPRGSSEDTGA